MDLVKLSPSDIESVVELDRRCFPPEIAFSEMTFLACLHASHCQTVGIKENGKLVAFAVIHFPNSQVGQVFTIDVHPTRRRQGMAESLMQELEKISRQKGVKKIFLQVATDNRAAIDLYFKQGYSIVGTMHDYYGAGKDAFSMDKVLMDL